MIYDELEGYVRALFASSAMRALWGVSDRGVPVLVHSVDVLLLCLDRFPEWRQYGELDLTATVIGALVHDASKLTAHQLHGCSHSHLMSASPERAVEAARLILDEVAGEGMPLTAERLQLVEHIVASHHGQYGKVHPKTPEARLVHLCDLYSSTNHRLVPVDANDILPLLDIGCRMQHVGVRLGVGRAVVKTRLSESCKAEKVRDWVDLIEIWRRNGHVTAGSPEMSRQIERVRRVVNVSREAPDSFLSQLREVAGYERRNAVSGLSVRSRERGNGLWPEGQEQMRGRPLA